MSRERSGGNVATVKWRSPYEDVRQSDDYECILSARRWTLKDRRTGAILASYNYLYECYADVERREASRKQWRQDPGRSLLEVYNNGPRLPDNAVEADIVHKYKIFCQWEDTVRGVGCVACWSADSDRPMSNAECYAAASEAGYVYRHGRIECGDHNEE